jgi:hypothetical protein
MCRVAVCLTDTVRRNQSGRFIPRLRVRKKIATKTVPEGSVFDLNIADTLFLMDALLLLRKVY